MTGLRNFLGLLAIPLALVVALPAAALAIPFLLVSGGVRLLADLLEREAEEWHEIVDFDPEIGWRPRPGVDGYQVDMNGDTYRLQTGDDGWRAGGAPMHRADVVVFGDSFAFGNAIDDRRFFANLREGVRIKAVGSPGYNMVQELLLMERYAEELDGKYVVWLVYPGNDLDENLRPDMGWYRIPFVRRGQGGDWEIVTEHVSPEEWPFPRRGPNHERYVRMCTPGTYLSRRAFSACEYLIGRGAEACRGAGARLTVAVIPDRSEIVRQSIDAVLAESEGLRDGYRADLPAREIERICRDTEAGFIDLANFLGPSDYHARDVHWNARGHRKVSSVIADFCRFDTEESAAAAEAGTGEGEGRPVGATQPSRGTR